MITAPGLFRENTLHLKRLLFFFKNIFSSIKYTLITITKTSKLPKSSAQYGRKCGEKNIHQYLGSQVEKLIFIFVLLILIH